MCVSYVYYHLSMNQRLTNFKKIGTDHIALWAWFFTLTATWFLWRYFTNLDLAVGNMWTWFAYTEIVTYIIFMLFFSVFISASVYKRRYFSNFNIKTSSAWSIWGIFGVLVAGCPACSITLASYLWLASLISLLPYKWLELKILWIILLGYACRNIIKDIDTCVVTPHTNI